MTESLKERLTEAMKSALKQKQKDRLMTVRMILAAIKRREIDERIELDDAQVVAVMEKMLKQCRDSQRQYADAGREDLVAKEAGDIAVLEEFMPAPLTDAEIDAAIEHAIAESGAASPQDMGKVMKLLKDPLQGRADMKSVSARVKERLSG